jgi:predicted NBD/HSP70 family sugar kinase
MLLQVAEDARLLVGIDLAEREFCGALVNLRGQIVQRLRLPVSDSSAETALEQVYDLIEQLLKLANQPVIGIGIGVPGFMNPETRSVREAINLDWYDLPLGDLLFQRFQLPIHLANDCQVAALGEYTFGETQDSANLMLIKVGRGVGAGIVLGGQIFYGDNAGAGEIGHIQVVKDGALCRCGNHGCLETMVSSRVLLQQAQAEIPEASGSLDALFQAYEAGNPQVISLVESAAQTLGRSVTHLVSALNINRVLVAGSLSTFGGGLIEPLLTCVQTGVLPALAQNTKVGLATLGDEIVILGAASLILKKELGLF